MQVSHKVKQRESTKAKKHPNRQQDKQKTNKSIIGPLSTPIKNYGGIVQVSRDKIRQAETQMELRLVVDIKVDREGLYGYASCKKNVREYEGG